MHAMNSYEKEKVQAAIAAFKEDRNPETYKDLERHFISQATSRTSPEEMIQLLEMNMDGGSFALLHWSHIFYLRDALYKIRDVTDDALPRYD